MKKNLKILGLIPFVLAGAVVGCNSNKGGNQTGELTDIEVAAGYKRYDLGQAAPFDITGFGAQMDTDIFMPWNHMTEEDIAIWEQRIQDMNMNYTRIKFFPEFFERANDNDDPFTFDFNADGVDFECVEMQALYKLLDWCEEYGIKVDLSWYGCYHNFISYDGLYRGSWLGYDTDAVKADWVTGPTDYDEYAENVCACLHYLINVKHYTCIWGVSNIFEMFVDGTRNKTWSGFVDACRKIDSHLKTWGLRDKVKLFSDCPSDKAKQFEEGYSIATDIFDVCGVGNYMWDYTCLNEAMYNYFTEMIEATQRLGKTEYAISEFCEGKHFLDAVNKTDIDDYTAGLYIARFCIEASRAGVTAFDHYILGDTFFTNAYIHTMGLWMYRDSNLTNPDYISWAAHPEWYFYSMITRYCDAGARCYSFNQELISEYDEEDPDLAICAFRLPNGKWTYQIANHSTSTKKIALVNPRADRPGVMKMYKVTPSSIPEDRNCDLIQSFNTVDASSGVTYLSVPANGLLTVSDKF